jgi:O-antigen ligase
MSPTLHRYVYGVEVYGGIRYLEELGSWGSRPSVFLANPLELGIYLTAACMCGLALWKAGRAPRIGPLPTVLLLAGLLAVTLLCKNLGATVLLFAGATVLYLSQRWRSGLALGLLVFLPPSYALVRGTGAWSANEVVEVVSLLHAGRAQSFEFRLENENILIDKALERPLLGWGGWGRSRVYDEMGNDRSVTDGSWVIALGKTGLFGLLSLLATFAVPVLVSMRGLPRRAWRLPALTPAIALAVTACLYSVDGLFNDFPNPLLVLSLGALAGLRPLRFQHASREPVAPEPAAAVPLAS